MSTWHLDDETARRYAAGAVSQPLAASAEAHLTACAQCRALLVPLVDGGRLDTIWDEVAERVDTPRPGPVERLLQQLGVRAHTARLLAATPSLRASWLLAIVAALVFTVLAADAGPRGTLLFLTLAPILPLAGVALAYGPQVDRLHELGAAAPLSGFRLLLLRSAAVVATTTLLAGGAGLFLPGAGGVAAAWLLPALALSLLTLALSARLEPVQAAGGLAAGWVAVVISAQREAGGEAALAEGEYAAFGVTGQLICLSLALACAAVLVLGRRHYAAVLGRTA